MPSITNGTCMLSSWLMVRAWGMSLAPPNRTKRPKEELDMKILIVAALALTLAPSTARRLAVYTLRRRCLWWPCVGERDVGRIARVDGRRVSGRRGRPRLNLNNNLFNTEDRTCWVSIGTFSSQCHHSWATCWSAIRSRVSIRTSSAGSVGFGQGEHRRHPVRFRLHQQRVRDGPRRRRYGFRER